MLKWLRKFLGLHEHQYVTTETEFVLRNRYGDEKTGDVMITTTCKTCPFIRRRWKYGGGPSYWET